MQTHQTNRKIESKRTDRKKESQHMDRKTEAQHLDRKTERQHMDFKGESQQCVDRKNGTHNTLGSSNKQNRPWNHDSSTSIHGCVQQRTRRWKHDL